MTYKAVLFQAYSAGRYAFHFRDESDSNRWTRLSQHTTLQIRDPAGGYVTPPLVTGTAPPAFSVSHQPSIGYLAYHSDLPYLVGMTRRRRRDGESDV